MARIKVVMAASVVCAVLGLTSLGWACSINPSMEMNPTSGRVGDAAQVRGTFWNSGPVEIRWNSASGRQIGAANSNGSWFAHVTIPPASPGVYSVVAVQTDALGAKYTASIAFTVTGPAAASNPQTQPKGTEGDVVPADTGDPGTEGDSSPADPGTVASSPPSGSTSGPGTENNTSSGPAGSSAGAQESPGVERNDGTADRTSAGPGATVVASVAASTDRSSSTGGRTAAPQRAGNVASDEVAVDSDPGVIAPVSNLTFAGDLWSGFEAGRALTAGPSLTVPGDGDGMGPLAGGVAVLTLGLGALALGFGVAEVSRRRARAHSIR